LSYNNIILACCVAAAVFFSLSCNETLPAYVAPKNFLALKVETVQTLNAHVAPPGEQMVRIVVSCENIFDEVFQDTVNVHGTLHITWVRKPVRDRTIYITLSNMRERELISNAKLLLVPGQSVSFETFWNLKGDDSLYFPQEMNWANLRKRTCGYNTACSDPEEFVIDATINLYDRVGNLVAPPQSFMFVGTTYILPP
jgi:hypothetical protein